MMRLTSSVARRAALATLALSALALGACEPSEPPPNAPCLPGNEGCEPIFQSCSDDNPCGEGFDCADGACVAACPAGTVGCACDPDAARSCGDGLTCDADSVCVDPECPLGLQGCACNTDGTCAPGPFGVALTCQAGLCDVVEDDSEAPGTPSADCYTPCSQSLTMPDGTFRYCSDDGLMEGCIAGLECVQGSCVGDGELPNACAGAVDCPSHQTCIGNICLSNCDLDADCSDGAACHELVCRQRCSAVSDDESVPCPSGFLCNTSNGTEGVCAPQVDVELPAPETAGLPFSVSVNELEFNNNRVSNFFDITNNSERVEDFVVRKVEHTEITIDGRQVDSETPLFWIEMGELGAEALGDEYTVEVLPGETVSVSVTEAFNETIDRWEGRIVVVNDRLGEHPINLTYSTRPDGQWSGSIHYFINFDDADIDNWINKITNPNAPAPDKRTAADQTQNAFVRQWTDFRTNALYTQRQWDALLHATLTGSWEYATVQEACDEQFSESAFALCYLYANGSPNDDGIEIYTDDETLRVPTGVMEMPYTIRLKAAQAANTYEGRVETPYSLQYPGMPPVTLEFAASPDTCESDTAEACLVPIKTFSSEVLVGGRYVTDGECGESTFEKADVPWLVPNFVEGTVQPQGSPRVRKECRESTFPFDGATSLGKKQNLSLAGANPIPDGRVRQRTVELMDGVMINADTLLLLVRETFTANLASGAQAADFSAYGIVQLRRAGGDIEDDGYTPGVLPDVGTLPAPNDKLSIGCSDDLVNELIGSPTLAGNEETVALMLLTGADASGLPPGSLQMHGALTEADELHYLCHDTGRIDGAQDAWTAGEPCPLGSRVTFFFWDEETTPWPPELANCAGDPSNRCGQDEECPIERRGTCEAELAVLDGDPALWLDAPYVCADGGNAPDPTIVLCNDDRDELRNGKFFYDPAVISTAEPVSPSIATMVDEAFRYKTRFKSRTGKTLGFVPEVCTFGDEIPYCHDPALIEEVRERMDCLTSLYAEGELSGSTLTMTDEFLTGSLSVFYDDGDDIPDRDGFERLYTELLVMLGDEALTNAVASRFDLAGTQIGLFEGDLFEPDGIRLSGGAGYEMRLLYSALQYYQLALDRFHRMSPTLWAGLDNAQLNFISLDSISTYFNRLILASTKKAKAASEIARRYQNFDRADLARHAIERSYTEAYLESIALSQLMRNSVRVLDASEVDALRFELKQAQRQYRQALGQMRETYQGLTDEITFFGDPPDYVPFPGTSRYDVPSVQKMLDRAEESLNISKVRDEQALNSNRGFDVDAARFQSELARISLQYENQLADLCGEFDDGTGTLYPAIRKYAHLNSIATLLGDPCGRMGNGEIHQQAIDLQAEILDLRIEVQSINDIFADVEIEQDRVDGECAGRVNIAQINFDIGAVINLQHQIGVARNEIADWNRELSELDRAASLASSIGEASEATAVGQAACANGELPPPAPPGTPSPPNPVACGVATAAAAVATASHIAASALNATALATQVQANNDIDSKENEINNKQRDIAELRQAADYRAAVGECCLDPLCPAGQDPPENCSGDADPDNLVACCIPPPESYEELPGCDSPGPLMINSEARVDTLMLGLMRAQLEAQRADVEAQRARGELRQLRLKAERLMAQQEETEQHLINVEAARNDPNVRIYANADVLNADKAFRDALVDAFRATRMFEYYTAQSYAAKEDLLLVRMAARGENNLQDYIINLDRDFADFQQLYGSPSQRVALISLRDDIFAIPEVDESGYALSPAQRTDAFREKLTDPGLLDDYGYIRVPFSTTLDMTSPLTGIHKVVYVEAEVQGSDVGDRLGRVYLTARGTGTIRDLEGGQQYNRMTPLTAVINPFFNGVRVFDPDFYGEGRLKDRPFVNNLWELALNLRDEAVNEDINVNSITDVRLFFFYEDFSSE
jgi:hypothetical protein